MFTKAISANTEKALELLGKSKTLDRAYLGGGTALALQLGHRISIDLDFFTPEEFEETTVIKQLKKIGKFAFNESNQRLVSGIFNKVNFDLYLCHYPVLFPFKCLCNLKILDARDIAAMKLAAITARGAKRDFVDLYFVCKNIKPLRSIISIYKRKFPGSEDNIIPLKKSLIYFADAESERMPHLLKRASWNDIKSYFEQQVKNL